ncbi:4-coumarate- ligase [Ophiostoma piceae UAMH 11346]|uniref:4-coumarate-ligase n=1 Tax=Ophiostoma piceae (strain UAMH 11346) TaxID=1262450 RepID=S3CP52_OPHP1|nr:4-coumarate- ligase [Ophiostoma piceae UAMH 11346]
MTIKARHFEPVPNCSLQQWIFGSSQEAQPDKKIYVDPERPETHFVTKTGYRLLAKRVAIGLQDAGHKTGDRVLLFSSNSLYVPSIFLGVLMAGGIFTGANPLFVARELAYQLRDSGASFMICAASTLDTGVAAADLAGLPRDHIYVLDDFADTPANVPATNAPVRPSASLAAINAVKGGRVRHWLDFVDGNLNRALVWDWREPADAKTTTCCLNYSSGTTGVPKGVEISHSAYVANCQGVCSVGDRDPVVVEQRKRAVGLCFLPLYHAYGQTYFVATMPFLDITTYIMSKFEFAKFLEYIERYRVTTLTLVPPIAVLLSKSPLAKKTDLSSVEIVGCGAAPLAMETQMAVQRLWPVGQLDVRQGWGMTEVTCSCMSWTHETVADGPAVGELLPNCMARIVEVDGEGGTSSTADGPKYITEPNKPGELWVTGPTLMTGYWRNPKATTDTTFLDKDGVRWLKTGDIAYINKYEMGGAFYIVDRRKELIKVKGNQVAPAELEAVLLERPDIADAAVIGVKVDSDERPRAYVVRVPGSSATAEEIAAWIATKVAPYKRLVGGVIFTDAIPKNPSGKILRKILRDQAAKEKRVAKL